MNLRLKNLLTKVILFFKIPMLSYMGVKIVENTDSKTVAMIKLKRRTRNHINVMFAGALLSGADFVVGVAAMDAIIKSKKPVIYALSRIEADFLKQARADTYFECLQVQEIYDLIQKAIDHPGQRFELPINVTARCPDDLGEEPVAKFVVTLVTKRKQL